MHLTKELLQPNQRGIIAGQLFDPATPYTFTQRMRENFPSASLLTSRSFNHAMLKSVLNSTMGSSADPADKDPECQANIDRYFKKGIVDFVDGQVCESDPIYSVCTINDVTDGWRGKQCAPHTKNKQVDNRIYSLE